MKKFFQEFKEFAMRGNVLDMAVGVVVGSAFTAIVTSIVQNLLTPLLGLLIPDSTFAEWAPGGFGIGAVINSVISFLITAFVAFHFVWGANYLPAWMLFLLLCVVLLYILSIPRYVSLDDTSIDIHCIVDLTRIHLEDVELIRRIEPDEFRRLWPLLGSYGFWGYFGYYFSFREWNLYKVYASERKNLVLIEDIYEDTFIISCEQADELITLVIEARDRKRAEILRHTGKIPGGENVF